ncbi:MAG: hypothetical protein ACRBN8_30440 [Nannocystales bacterium]
MTIANRTSAEHFERAKAVLAGEPYSTSDRAVRKVVRSVDSFEGSNLWINREAFEMRWVNENRKRAHSFFLDLAPGLVLDLMSRMGVSEISTPTVGHLAPSRAQLAMLAGDDVDRVAWIIRPNPTPCGTRVGRRAVAGSAATSALEGAGSRVRTVPAAPRVSPLRETQRVLSQARRRFADLPAVWALVRPRAVASQARLR